MKILLVCAGGFSTTMMMGAIKKVVEKSEKLDINDFTPMEAIPVDMLSQKISNFDIVLVGPQLGHKFEHIQEVAKENDKPSVLLSAEIYGAMDGATVLKQAILAHRKYHA
nr:PTS sugar transporter subunit IIB [uncultured Cetobacterium sp.]